MAVEKIEGIENKRGAIRGNIMKSVKKRRKHLFHMSVSNRAAMIVITGIVCILAVVLTVKGLSLREQIKANASEKEKLTAQVEEEQSRTEEIEALRDYYESDDYIREIAQDRLGLVEDGQIVFRSED